MQFCMDNCGEKICEEKSSPDSVAEITGAVLPSEICCGLISEKESVEQFEKLIDEIRNNLCAESGQMNLGMIFDFQRLNQFGKAIINRVCSDSYRYISGSEMNERRKAAENFKAKCQRGDCDRYEFIFWALMVLKVDDTDKETYFSLICEFAGYLEISEEEMLNIIRLTDVIYNKNDKKKERTVPMEKIISALNEIQEINNRYEITTENIRQLQEEIAEAKVCTPIIGKFSSGKSALVNAILGYNNGILKEDITPETAVPAEILYTPSNDEVMIIKNDNTCENISVDDFRRFEADAATVKCVRLFLKNGALEQIPDVMLVDMPGFESGFEIHNRAIDNYLPKSMAYIVAFPADDMIVRDSVGKILRELCLYDMPICVVITKCDKKNDDFDITLAKMKESLKKYIGDREIRYCETSGRKGNVEELESFLEEIQEKSQDILAAKYRELALAVVDNTENYLKTTLNCSQMTESELDEKEDKLQKRLSGLESKFSKEQADFELEISEVTEEIKGDVQCAMEAEESRLVAMAMNNQSINDHLNSVIRSAVTVSIQKRFIPKIERYVKRVEACINSDAIADIPISFHYNTAGLDKGITSSIVAVAAGILLGLPILGIVAGIVMKLMGNRKREEAKRDIRMKLQNEVFPKVLREVGAGVEKEIARQVGQVNACIETELENQKDTLGKALADVREKLNTEKETKEKLTADLEADLERIGEIRDELR